MRMKRLKLKKIHGLILGSLLGGAFALSGSFMLVPIFEKSQENAKEIVQLSSDKGALEEKLESTNSNLDQANSTIEAQNKEIEIKVQLEGTVQEQKQQISSLQGEREELSNQSSTLQQEVESKTEEVNTQKEMLDEQDLMLSEKDAQIDEISNTMAELREIDDQVITNSRYVVGGFMKIADRERFSKMSRMDRHELIQETMRLSNQLESDTNKRKDLWRQAEEKIIQFREE